MLTKRRLCVLVVASSVLLANCPAAQNAQDLHGWSVDSSVAAVQLVGVEQVGSTPAGPIMSFNLKNTSPKPISAVVVVTPDRGNHLRDYFGREPLAPGAAYSLSVVVPQAVASERVLKIPAVVLADGGSQGERSQIAFIKARRLGTALETERIKRILDSFGTDDALTTTGAASVISAVGARPQSAEEAANSVRDVAASRLGDFDAVLSAGSIRFALFGGVSDARQAALRHLGELTSPSAAQSVKSTEPSVTEADKVDTIVSFRKRITVLTGKENAELAAMQ
jgi:hypothetical protein